MVEDYFKKGDNATSAARSWSSKHKNKPKPNRGTFENLVSKFRRTGSVHDDKELMKTKPRTARTPEIIEQAREEIVTTPGISERELGRNLGISQPSAHRILRKDLGFTPYKIQTFQALGDRDVKRRFDFAADTCQLIDDKKLDPHKILFTDEAHFHLDGYVNKQNYRIWGTEKPSIRTKPLHPKRVTAWAGMSSKGIVGPIFVDDNKTIDGKRYNQILRQAIPEAKANGMVNDFHWQQDGAPPHRTRENLDFIHKHYDGRVIAKGFPARHKKGMDWPPYSPDLSPMDYYLWGNVKDKVYKNRPTDLPALKQKISDTMSAIPEEELKKTIDNFEKRLRLTISKEGEHIEDMLH